MEPPKTPEEQAELERAIADMLEGGESSPPQGISVTELFGPVGRVLLRSAIAPAEPKSE